MTKVAIVTVDYNGHKDTSELLESVKKLDTNGLEILWLVVDNGSDTSIKNVIKDYKWVSWMQTGKNLGYTGGYNKGMKYAYQWGADYVLIINNDTLFNSPNLLKKMIGDLNKNSKVGVVSPKVYFAPGYEFFKEKYSKSDVGKVIWYAGANFDWANIGSTHRGIDEVDKGQYDLSEKTEFTSGCCMLIRRNVFEKIGYFEEKLFAYLDDADWMVRLKNSGFEEWYEGSVSIYHKVGRTAEIGSSWTDYLITRNRLWFGFKYAPFRTRFALFREAIKFLIVGRTAQKEGVMDFFNGVWGYKKAKAIENPEYPLDLSIIIVNFNTNDLTNNAVKSVENGHPGVRSETIVIDNGSDETFEVPNSVKFIKNQKNLGFAVANNQGIEFSLGKYVLLLNSDAEAKKGSIEALYNFAKSHKNLGAVAGRLLNDDGSIQGSVYKLPTVWRTLFEGVKKYSPVGNTPQKVDAPSMAAFLITPEALEKIGLLNEKYFMYFEDLDYCREIKRKGMDIYYLPDAEVIHHHGSSGKNLADAANQWRRAIPSSILYHGKINHFLINTILWVGQKLGKKY